MPRSTARFTSDRERRLWLWAAVVLVAIYATLGPAQVVAESLRERNLLRVTMGAVLLVALSAAAVQWVRTRPGRREVGVALGLAAVYVTAGIRVASVEERTHLFEYGLVAILLYQALLERRSHGRRVPVPAVLAFAVTVLLGWLDEGIQAVLPNRVFDYRDILFNAVAGLMAIIASLAMTWARRWAAKPVHRES